MRKQELNKNEYRCSACENVYEKAWSDEEAMAESKEIWGEIPVSEMVVICDDCFNKRTTSEIREMGKEYKKEL